MSIGTISMRHLFVFFFVGVGGKKNWRFAQDLLGDCLKPKCYYQDDRMARDIIWGFYRKGAPSIVCVYIQHVYFVWGGIPQLFIGGTYVDGRLSDIVSLCCFIVSYRIVSSRTLCVQLSYRTLSWAVLGKLYRAVSFRYSTRCSRLRNSAPAGGIHFENYDFGVCTCQISSYVCERAILSKNIHFVLPEIKVLLQNDRMVREIISWCCPTKMLRTLYFTIQHHFARGYPNFSSYSYNWIISL